MSKTVHVPSDLKTTDLWNIFFLMLTIRAIAEVHIGINQLITIFVE